MLHIAFTKLPLISVLKQINPVHTPPFYFSLSECHPHSYANSSQAILSFHTLHYCCSKRIIHLFRPDILDFVNLKLTASATKKELIFKQSISLNNITLRSLKVCDSYIYTALLCKILISFPGYWLSSHIFSFIYQTFLFMARDLTFI